MMRALLLGAALLSPVVAEAASTDNGPAEVVAKAKRAALREPSRSGFVGGVHIYSWANGALYRLYAAPERVTDIALEPGETLVAVAAGDTARWTVSDTISGAGEARRVHILVKPFSAGLSTNLLITTDRRTYHVELQSLARTAMSGIAWRYPKAGLLALARRPEPPLSAGLELEQLGFDYEISGDEPPWRPLLIFDDGRQTFIQFPVTIGEGEAPPLFVLGADGEPQLVNYRMSGRFYIVDRLFGAAELRLGKHPQQVVRISRTGGERDRSGS